MDNSKITAVVVTYNRKDLLLECLEALTKQTVSIDVLLVDNASTDGTEAAVREWLQTHPDMCTDIELKNKQNRLQYHRLSENLGGAGGFSYGMKAAVKDGAEYIWIMDDDTIPNPDAAEKLWSVISKEKLGFVSSTVLWTDGTPCKMNRQTYVEFSSVATKKNQTETPENKDEVSNVARAQNLSVLAATFVSLMFSAEIIREMGLPIKEYFIWGDDKEYTLRLSEKYPCVHVTDSVVVHKMKINEGSNITTDHAERISRYFYAYRNDLCTAKRRGMKEVAVYYAAFYLNVARILFKSKESKKERIAIMRKGMKAGKKFNPQIEYI